MSDSAVPVYQEIQSGSAILLVADAPTEATAGTRTQIDESASPSGYTAIETALTVDDASTIAPNVWETSSGSISDPPVIDVIANCRSGEIVFAYSRTDATEVINVIRGVGKLPEKRGYTDSQFNAAMNDNDYLEQLGYFTAPSIDDLIITNNDVSVNAAQGIFKPRDNYLGYSSPTTSEPANVQLTFTVPRNVEQAYRRTLGYPVQTDGNSPATYFELIGAAAAGVELVTKMFIVVPISVYSNKTYRTIGASNYLSLEKCMIIWSGGLSTEFNPTYSEGSQTELSCTIEAKFDPVVKAVGHAGSTKDMNRIMPTV